jgi:hypothetical protein
MLTRAIKVRFSSARSIKTAFAEQRESVRVKEASKARLLTHDGYISPVMILTGLEEEESQESSLNKLFISCQTLSGRDNLAQQNTLK